MRGLKKSGLKPGTETGKKFEIEGEDMLARALCHEIDHLKGILFIDKVIKFVKPDSGE